MRITSELFVAQLVRRAFGAGGFAAVVRRGAEAAGAIFVIARGRSDTTLFGPAPQSLADDDGERRFTREAAADDAAITARFERESRFDPDFWVVEIEAVEAAGLLTVVGGEG